MGRVVDPSVVFLFAQYDPNGNQYRRMTSTVAVGSSEGLSLSEGLVSAELYRYNGFDRLTEAHIDGIDVTYTYYPSGLRATKATGGVETRYILDGANVVLETENNSVTAKYTPKSTINNYDAYTFN